MTDPAGLTCGWTKCFRRAKFNVRHESEATCAHSPRVTCFAHLAASIENVLQCVDAGRIALVEVLSP